MAENNNNNEGKDIKLNKNMRIWNRFRGYIIGAVFVIVVIVACVLIFKSCNSKETEKTEITVKQTTASRTETAAETRGTEKDTEPATTEAKKDNNYESYKVPGVVTEEEFTGADKLAGSVVLGDSIAEGVSFYHFLDDSKVIFDRSLTTGKAIDRIDSVFAAEPDNVFIMLGLNDTNSDISTESIVNNLLGLADKIKETKQEVNVYIVSILPVTQEFESESSVSQSQINDVNDRLEKVATEHKATYVDVASAYKDDSGYLNTNVTSNGSNIINTYYPFLLNGLAGAIK